MGIMDKPENLPTDIKEGDRVRATLESGERIEGTANPVEYLPGDRIDIEIRTDRTSPNRYRVHTVYEGDAWERPKLLGHNSKADRRWTPVGDLATVEIVAEIGESEGERTSEEIG